ncbi:hypothetical protein C0991_008688, partial [Blastosporella zonata]
MVNTQDSTLTQAAKRPQNALGITTLTAPGLEPAVTLEAIQALLNASIAAAEANITANLNTRLTPVLSRISAIET